VPVLPADRLGQPQRNLRVQEHQRQRHGLHGDEGHHPPVDVLDGHLRWGHALQIEQGPAEGGRQERGLQVHRDQHRQPDRVHALGQQHRHEQGHGDVADLDPLDEEALVRILTEPRNALVRQYQKLFEMEGAELEFDSSALKAIAQKAKDRDTGARGLRSIIEEIMLDMQFELPELETKGKFVITDKMIKGETKLFDSNNSNQDKKSA